MIVEKIKMKCDNLPYLNVRPAVLLKRILTNTWMKGSDLEF